jgi:hypothetical protein
MTSLIIKNMLTWPNYLSLLTKLNAKCWDAAQGHILTLLQVETRRPVQHLLSLRHPHQHRVRGQLRRQEPPQPQAPVHPQVQHPPQVVHGISRVFVAANVTTWLGTVRTSAHYSFVTMVVTSLMFFILISITNWRTDTVNQIGGEWMGADKNSSRRRWRLQQDEHGFQHTSLTHYPSCPSPRSHWSATGPKNQQTTFQAKTHQHAQRKLARLAASAALMTVKIR